MSAQPIARIGRLAAFAAGACLGAAGPGFAEDLTPIEQLGRSIFFDRLLSLQGDQSCADCHGPEAGWTGPLSAVNAHGAVYEGSVDGLFGARKPPSAAYATESPIFYYDSEEGLFVGGNFWDGRATGERLGNPAADQAQGPFLNPVEQALPDKACVVHAVCTAPAEEYPVSFENVWGAGTCDIVWPDDVWDECDDPGGSVALSGDDPSLVAQNYDRIALSIAAYEASPEVNAYTSKYDYFRAGLVRLTGRERQGLNLFMRKGMCADCHTLDEGPNGEPPLLTNFTFDNLGVPRNPENPFYDMDPIFNPYGEAWVDSGLGGFLATRVEFADKAPENMGKHKVPTLRNVDLRPNNGFAKAYMHNGYFKSLKGVVHFYNTRDVKPTCPDPFTPEDEALRQGCWPTPEIPVNVNDRELGDLKLSDMQEDAIVAFLKTLSDGYGPPIAVTPPARSRAANR